MIKVCFMETFIDVKTLVSNWTAKFPTRLALHHQKQQHFSPFSKERNVIIFAFDSIISMTHKQPAPRITFSLNQQRMRSILKVNWDKHAIKCEEKRKEKRPLIVLTARETKQINVEAINDRATRWTNGESLQELKKADWWRQKRAWNAFNLFEVFISSPFNLID